jgi:hypothetical protein
MFGLIIPILQIKILLSANRKNMETYMKVKFF